MRPLRGSVNPFWDRFKKTRTTRLYKGYRIDGDGTGTSFEIRAQGVKFGSMRDAQRWADAEVREEAKAAKYEAQQAAKDRRDEVRAAGVAKRLAHEAAKSSSRKHSARVSSRYRGYRLTGGRDGWEVPELDKGSLFDSKADAKKFVDAQVRSNPMARRKNAGPYSFRKTKKTLRKMGSTIKSSKRRKASVRGGKNSPEGQLVPAKLKRMPNGMIKVYVAPGAMAKLRANPAHITLSGRNGSVERVVYADDTKIGTVSKTADGWKARDTRGRNHGDQYTSDWNAAKQLALGLKK